MFYTSIVLLGALLPFLGSASYARDMLHGRTKPNLVSWSLWAIAPLVAFAAELSQKVGAETLLTFVVGFGPLCVVITALVSHKAYWKITRFDITCGIFSFSALILWAITGKGDVAIIFSILSDFSAAIPTIIKSYKASETESAGAFALSALGAFITLFTVKHWIFSNYIFTLYICLVSILITAIIIAGTRHSKVIKQQLR